MKTIDEINWKGKKALIRVDFNVPLDDQHRILDHTRIEGAMPTLEHILDQQGSIILMSHLGRPKGKYDEDLSLKHVVQELEKRLNRSVKFAPDCIGKEAQDKARHLKNGEVLLLENLRFHAGEREGSAAFAGELASLGDAYVNDAFGASHRRHASITEVPKYFREKFGGELLELEMEKIDLLLEKPKAPVTIILGGAKITDKIGTIEALLDKANYILIGGGMAYTFIKAQEGQIGKSLVDENQLEVARWLLNKSKRSKARIVLPVDSVISKSAEDPKTRVVASREIEDDFMGGDIGPETRRIFTEIIARSNTIFWNGPLGIFEKEHFQEGTQTIAQAIADATGRDAYTLVGGGDTTASITRFFLQGSFWHVSTGGGALLEYMEKRELPGIDAVSVPSETVLFS
ncbi:Phosphoglycerate kinase [Fulvivirga imtechensis AK7]|uniref:Phosphoglycerate kinase n=1 Tax=Fulvivirga imtechensis AK7 TaxID=1237149 RepID=L8JLV0_9BACT|nr:phosphoglycerate kinase [Fulvivirga imtechensis]ELR68362.1 Phosphoglycerate kinase [Fulvivirga imtechensis AK7]